MSSTDWLPRDIAVPCACGDFVPLACFVIDGRPHNQARCPHCGQLVFLTPQPSVRRVAVA